MKSALESLNAVASNERSITSDRLQQIPLRRDRMSADRHKSGIMELKKKKKTTKKKKPHKANHK